MSVQVLGSSASLRGTSRTTARTLCEETRLESLGSTAEPVDTSVTR